MAAGLGFKTFTTGEVLTAGDVNGYLMQGINVFASEAARNAAITSPQEGQFAFTKDNNSLWYYTGSAWAASGATGDIEGVTAGVGISGGGTSGTVTVTNSMATAIDAKGDLVPGTGADTFSRLAVGANGTVLTADSAEATGLKWATPASGSMTQLASGSLSSSVDLTSISSSYKNLTLIIRNFLPTATDGAAIAFRFNSDTNARYGMNNTGNATNIDFAGNERITTNDGQDSATSQAFIKLDLWDYTNTTTWKVFSCLTWTNNPTTSANANMRSLTGAYNQTGAISTINIFNNYGTATTGTYVLFGVN